MAKEQIFPHKYRVRRGFFGGAILQALVKDIHSREYEWVDVKFNSAPRALRSEIND